MYERSMCTQPLCARPPPVNTRACPNACRHGVAPGASILAYDIGASPCQETAAAGLIASAAALDAVRTATADGADVVNLSFGPGFGGPSYPDAELAAALTGIMHAGGLAVITSGNDGAVGPFATEAAVAAPGVISVASVATTLPLPGPQLVLLSLQPGSKQPKTLRECAAHTTAATSARQHGQGRMHCARELLFDSRALLACISACCRVRNGAAVSAGVRV